MANKDDIVKREEEIRKADMDKLANDPLFRKFLMRLMTKSRYLKPQGDLGDYERGMRDAQIKIVSEYVLGAKCGSEILAEYINNLHKGPNE